jgi:signal transduction histidine kinase
MEVERIQLAERDRIGQEIHDGAMQEIYSASLVLESMLHIHQPEEYMIRLDRARRILEGAVTDLRRYMTALRTDSPVESLREGLEQLANDPRYSSLIHVQIDLDNDAGSDLVPMQVGHVLAIVQESLSNTVRHAAARSATVHITRRNGNCLVITVRDDGHGFDPATISRGFGLRSINDHARLLGGKLEIQSSPGRPTTIAVSVTLESCNEQSANPAGR